MTIEYGSADYWDARYATHAAAAGGSGAALLFDWLGDYAGCVAPFVAHTPRAARVLIPGCGTSPLALDMHADGFSSIVGVDCSAAAVAAMQAHAAARGVDPAQAAWETGDARRTGFAAGRFDLVVDKSTLDAFVCAGEDDARAYLAECRRVVADDGVLLVVSYSAARSEILGELWAVEEHARLERRGEDLKPGVPGTVVHVYVCRKKKTE